MQPLLFRLQQAATIVFLCYVLVLLGRSAWKNAEINRKTADLKAEIARLETENAAQKNLLVYMETKTFKELEARKRLGVKKPGELVIALPPEPKEAPLPEPNAPQARAHPQLLIEAWWKYFFG